MRPQAGAAIYRRGIAPAANGTRSAHSQVLTDPGPMTHHPAHRSGLLIDGPATAPSSGGSVGLAARAQPPQSTPRRPALPTIAFLPLPVVATQPPEARGARLAVGAPPQ